MVLVLDNLHVLHTPAANAALARLNDTVPSELTLAVSSRTPPALPMARLRTQGRVTELAPPELALDPGETAAVLRLAGLELTPEELERLWSQTEGWPAAVALAALSLGDRSAPGAAATSGGDDRWSPSTCERRCSTACASRIGGSCSRPPCSARSQGRSATGSSRAPGLRRCWQSSSASSC